MLTLSLVLIGLILLIGELLTTSTFLLFIALGFFGAALASIITSNYLVLLIIGSVVTAITIGVFRDKYLTKVLKTKTTKTSYETILGDIGVVKKAFKGNTTEVGIVLVQNMEWSAKSFEDEEFKVGQEVKILKIDGVKVVVEEVR